MQRLSARLPASRRAMWRRRSIASRNYSRAVFTRAHVMTDSPPDGTLQALWQSQPSSERAMSIEEVREQARRLERRVARRNRREYIAAVVVVFGYGWILWRVPFATA